MAEQESTLSPSTPSVGQTAYAKPRRNRRPAGPAERHSTAAADFRGVHHLVERIEEIAQDFPGQFGVIVLYLDSLGTLIEAHVDEPFDEEGATWLRAWRRLYPAQQAAVRRQLVARALELQAHSIAVATDDWPVEPDREAEAFLDVEARLRDVCSALVPLGVDVLDHVIYMGEPGAARPRSAFGEGFYGGTVLPFQDPRFKPTRDEY